LNHLEEFISILLFKGEEVEKGKEMGKKAALMGTRLKRARVLTRLVVGFSLVFVGDSAPLTIGGGLTELDVKINPSDLN